MAPDRAVGEAHLLDPPGPCEVLGDPEAVLGAGDREDEVAALAADQHVPGRHVRADGDGVGRAAHALLVDGVPAAAAAEQVEVVAVAAPEEVAARAAIEGVVAPAADEGVAARAAV